MTLEEAVGHFGSQYKLCLALGISPQNFDHWRRKATFPAVHQLKIHIYTNGILAADSVHLIPDNIGKLTYRQGLIGVKRSIKQGNNDD